MADTGRSPPAGISFEGVSMTFAGVRAFEPVSLDVKPGAFVSIVGTSGCGKTTLLRIAAGLIAPSEGTVNLGGARPGMCFQDPRLLPWRNSLDNVTLPLELAGISPDERQDRGIDMLRMVGMGDAWNRMPAQLSGGMRMRVGLARALVERPPALLLDEPCSALDEITRETINELLADLWKELGMTVVLVTHSLAEAVYLGRQVVVMTGRPGRVVSVHGIHLPSRQPEVRTTVEFAQALQSIYRDMTLPRPPGGIAPSSLSKHAGAEP